MTNRQKITLFLSTAGMWPRIPTTIGMVIKEVCTIFAPPPLTFFDLISSLATRGYWKFVGKFPHCRKMLITWLIVPRKVTKLKTYNLPWDAYKHWEFRKNCANESLLRGEFVDKIPNFDSFRCCSVFPHLCPNKFHVYRSNVLPLFGLLSKHNTGRHAALPCRQACMCAISEFWLAMQVHFIFLPTTTECKLLHMKLNLKYENSM